MFLGKSSTTVFHLIYRCMYLLGLQACQFCQCMQFCFCIKLTKVAVKASDVTIMVHFILLFKCNIKSCMLPNLAEHIHRANKSDKHLLSFAVHARSHRHHCHLGIIHDLILVNFLKSTTYCWFCTDLICLKSYFYSIFIHLEKQSFSVLVY